MVHNTYPKTDYGGGQYSTTPYGAQGGAGGGGFMGGSQGGSQSGGAGKVILFVPIRSSYARM